MHGDVVAKASLSPTETKLLATYRFDEFGNPQGGSAGRFGWLGGKQRRTEFASGVIQMGARSYVPALGRFLTPDPVLGDPPTLTITQVRTPSITSILTEKNCVAS